MVSSAEGQRAVGSEPSTISRNRDLKGVFSRCTGNGEWKHICHLDGWLPAGDPGGGAITSKEKV